MGATLKNLVITATGDFGPGKGPDQLRKWVEANGGKWVPRVQKGLTHLIADKQSWKKNSEAVQQAKKLPDVNIVDYNWLEDSLQKKRKLSEKMYTWEHQRKQRRLSKTLKRVGVQADTKKFHEGCAKALEDIRSGMSSTISSSTRKDGLFASAMADLQRKREAREREAKQKNEAIATVPTTSPTEGSTASTTMIRDPGLEILRQAIQTSSTLPTPIQNYPKTTSKPTPAFKISKSNPPTRRRTMHPALKQASLSPHKPPSTPTAPSTTSPGVPAKIRLTDMYHVFMDTTGFTYDLEFIRRNPVENTFAKYDLRLYESNTVPHVYCTFIRYTPPAKASEMKVSSAANIVLDDKFVQNLYTTLSSFLQSPSSSSESNSTPASANNTPPKASPTAPPPTLLDASPSTPPPATHPFRTLLAPPNSPYATAFHAFRHAFYQLTLLTWEERTADPRASPALSTQNLRARAFNIEPFLWSNRPAPGAPYGVFPALPLPPSSSSSSTTYPALPALQTPLSPSSGAYGALQAHEAAAAKARADALAAKEKEREKELKRERDRLKAKERAKARAPLFNGVNGPPELANYYRTTTPSPAATPRGSPGPTMRRSVEMSPGVWSRSPSRAGSVVSWGTTTATATAAAPSSPGLRFPAVFTHFLPRKGVKAWPWGQE